MIFASFLSLAFVLMAIYSFVFIRSLIVRYILIVTYGLAIYFIWRPDVTTVIANYFGIGRGLDFVLIMLSVSIINALLFIVMHLIVQNKNITKMARNIAISNACHANKKLDR